MIRSPHLRTALLAAALSMAAAPALALPSSSFMPIGAPMFAPKGYVEFCGRRPDQCDLASSGQDRRSVERAIYRLQWRYLSPLQPTSAGAAADDAQQAHSDDVEAAPQAISLDDDDWAALNRINRSINARIQPMSDEQAFGVSDYWTLPLSDEPRAVGNCKHYVLEKRKALVDAGVPSDALSIAIVRTASGEPHAVLIIATDRGDLVLDNLSPEIKGWREVDYAWLSRQVPGHVLQWAAVGSPVRLLRY
jgi:predicted transglutaminase-like cysteine proteinase